MFKTAVFDIETSQLDGSYGRILCVGFKEYKKKPIIVEVPSLKEERHALKEIRDLWDSFDIVMGWNSLLFDVPMLNARYLRYAMNVLPTKKHVDLMWIHKHYARTRGHRLAGVASDLGVETVKFEPGAECWQIAAESGHPEHKAALAKVVKHNYYDLIMTEEVAEKLKPLVGSIQKR